MKTKKQRKCCFFVFCTVFPCHRTVLLCLRFPCRRAYFFRSVFSAPQTSFLVRVPYHRPFAFFVLQGWRRGLAGMWAASPHNSMRSFYMWNLYKQLFPYAFASDSPNARQEASASSSGVSCAMRPSSPTRIAPELSVRATQSRIH